VFVVFYTKSGCYTKATNWCKQKLRICRIWI